MAPHGIVGVSRQLCPSEVSEGHGFFCRNGSAFDEGGQRVFCESTLSGLLPICKLLPASPFACFHKFPRCPPLISRLAAAPIVFFSPLRQNHCQYVNYCLRSFPCLCANSLAVRLFARTSSSLCRTSYPFIALLLYRLRALSCAFTKSLAVRLSSHASPLLRSYFFHHCDRTIAERRVRRAQR